MGKTSVNNKDNAKIVEINNLVRNAISRECKSSYSLFDPTSTNYILRYYLPYWSVKKRIDEILAFCEATDTRHVMFLCGCQHMAWNIIPFDIAKLETEAFIDAAREFKKHGIKFGLNMGVTFGHYQNRWDHREKFPDIKYWKTDVAGEATHSSPCPEDDNLKEHVKRVYQIYAECDPAYIYIDDDLRFDISEKQWGCFCAKHINLFSEITGYQWSHDQLRVALYDDPNTRRQWIELLGNCIIDWARNLTNAVHAVNPEIAMGMMVPCVHTLPLFGHNLVDVLEELDDGVIPLVRPCIGGYSDHNRRDLVGGIIYMELVRHFLAGKQIEYTPEIETAPFTRLSKSMTVVRFHIAQAILNGMQNPAISAAGYVGDSIEVEPEYVKELPKEKPFFDALCSVRPNADTKRGVQLIYDFDSAKESKLQIDSTMDLAWSSFVSAKILGSLGISYTLEESSVKIVTGELFRTMSRQRIEKILGDGLIIDAVAAETLVDLGYSNDIGVNIGRSTKDWMAEKCTDPDFSGPYTGNHIPLKEVKELYRLLCNSDANIISRITDADNKELYPGLVLYENARGGKIAVLPFIISAHDGDSRHLLCYQRSFMLKKIINWMDPYALPVLVDEPTDVLVQSWDDGQVLTACLTNLSYDSCSEIKVRLICKARMSIEDAIYVADDGRIMKLNISVVDEGINQISACITLPQFSAFRPVVIRIPYKP